ncbi:co-chaperone GroES [Phycisphaerales bacterium AB-hyl4]|uniref:Co-chaperonin GroES n=1 Tax=Natronomicrosphaera hydrolytica TaxID=3242702 RepID=A0ABV4U2Q8_9BACT
MATATKTKTNLKPLDDRVVVKPQEAEDRTAGGIYLPESAKEKPMTGTVVAVGPGKLSDEGKRTPVSVKKGDVVLYGKYGGTEIELDGETVMVLRESELLGVVEK